MLSSTDIVGFKDYIDNLKQLAPTSKANYKTYVNWLQKYSSIDISAIFAFPEDRITDIAESIQHPRIIFNERRKSDARSILRHFRDYKNQRTIEEAPTAWKQTPDEQRKRILVSIAERRGQNIFRKKLFSRYHARCVVTGCDLEDVLEAAHIVPFSTDGGSVPSNGLLLRSDVHVLFDLYELSINPDTQKIHCSNAVRKSSAYANLHLQQVVSAIPADTFPSLRQHFEGLKKG